MSLSPNATRGKRATKPRDPIATAPTHVSQLNVTPIVGIDARRYLDLLVAHPEVPRAAVGRLRIVALEDLRSLLSRIATTSTTETAVDTDTDDAPMTADAVLSRIGMRRAS